MNFSKKIYYAIAAVVVFILIGYWQMLSAVSFFQKDSQFFTIKSGETSEEVAKNLKTEKLIRSKKTFILSVKMQGLDTSIRHGRYRLSRNMNLNKIISTLTNPDQTEIAITIPEGFSVREIDERLSQMGLIRAGEFSLLAMNYEGYLFPDTYYVYGINFNPQDLVEKMKDNFFKKITPELITQIEQQKRTLSEVITIASILEKEAANEKDYSLISEILWKRFDNDWPLQADATLLYGKNTTSITQSTLDEDSPYNTRKNKGLPPTPIGNPGLAVIHAAISPEKSPYWFYLTDNEGITHYAKTNEEHNRNREKYL